MRRLPIVILALLVIFMLLIPLPIAIDMPIVRFLMLFIVMGTWVLIFNAGWYAAEKDSVTIIRGPLGHVSSFASGANYLYIPGLHSIEAVIPNYSLKYEFDVNAIDTRTPRLQKIDKITIRVLYRVVDAKTFFAQSASRLERIKDLEQAKIQTRRDVGLWKQFTNEIMHGTIDDAVREVVWGWADALLRNPKLRLYVPFQPLPDPEYDPYALSLNREQLAAQLLRAVDSLIGKWGITIEQLVFENMQIDPQIIAGKTRNREGELKEAEHQAAMDAARIRIRGEAEIEVRAKTVAKVIEVLLNQKGLNLTNEVLYNVVRAAMYSDGEMIWRGMVEKSAPSSVKTA